MKFRIKDKKVEACLLALFSMPEIQETVDKQFNDDELLVIDFYYPDREADYMCNVCVNGKCFEPIPEYSPNDWNRFPEVQPPRDGFYEVALITSDGGLIPTEGRFFNGQWVAVDKCVDSRVFLFRERPKNTQEKTND